MCQEARRVRHSVICVGDCSLVDELIEPLPVVALRDMLERLVGIECRRRYVWIDALCIGQDSQEEKAENIPIMGSLYRCARHASRSWISISERA